LRGTRSLVDGERLSRYAVAAAGHRSSAGSPEERSAFAVSARSPPARLAASAALAAATAWSARPSERKLALTFWIAPETEQPRWPQYACRSSHAGRRRCALVQIEHRPAQRGLREALRRKGELASLERVQGSRARRRALPSLW